MDQEIKLLCYNIGYQESVVIACDKCTRAVCWIHSQELDGIRYCLGCIWSDEVLSSAWEDVLIKDGIENPMSDEDSRRLLRKVLERLQGNHPFEGSIDDEVDRIMAVRKKSLEANDEHDS